MMKSMQMMLMMTKSMKMVLMMMKSMKIVPLGVPECVVGQNPPASNDRQHEEPGGFRPDPSVNGPVIRRAPWLEVARRAT
jgi:hypothetical protein